MTPPPPEAVLEAAVRLSGHIHRTPVVTCRGLDEALGCRLFWKCENLQRTGAFKARGALNAVLSLGPEATAGVVTHSSGNHGSALAWAARMVGAPARVVVPRDASAFKRAAVARYGAEVVSCEPTQAAREAAALELLETKGGHLVPPFDDPRIVAGQGTAAFELLDQVDGLDWIVAPVGGGGLVAGTALAAALANVPTRIVGAEPARADDAARSLARGHRIASWPVPPDTVADGLRTALGAIPFDILREHRVEILLAREEAILPATRMLWERTKLVVEPSSAVPLAALLDQTERIRGLRIGVILSGGNVDFGGFFGGPESDE